MKTRTIRIALVDDHRVVTRSLCAYFALFPDLTVTGAAATGEQLLQHIPEWQPDVVVADLLLPGGIDGVETTRRIHAQWPQIRIVALTASTDKVRMDAVLRAGASGYVRKDAEPETLLTAIRSVASGRQFIDLPPTAHKEEDLSPREHEVLRHLAAGRSNKEIATVLEISEETVKTHVSRVLAKLGAENRSQAIGHSLRRGLLTLDDC